MCFDAIITFAFILMDPLAFDLYITIVWGNFLELTFTCGISECIRNKNPFGGLLLLLPQKNREKIGDNRAIMGDLVTKSVLADLERLLINSELPVSDMRFFCPLTFY